MEVENAQRSHDLKGSYIDWLNFLVIKNFCPSLKNFARGFDCVSYICV